MTVVRVDAGKDGSPEWEASGVEAEGVGGADI